MDDDRDFMPADSPGGAAEPGAGGPAAKDAKQKGEPEREPGERAELPTWNRSRRKRKANVKAAEQDDAFQRGVRRAGRRVIDFPKLVIGAIAIVVVGIAIAVFVQSSRVKGNADAARKLQEATATMVRGRILSAEERETYADQLRMVRFPIYGDRDERDAALDEALAAAKGSGRDDVVVNATLVEASLAVRRGDFEAAVSSYDRFLDEGGDDHPLRFLALEGKGVALEALERPEEALAVFESLAPEPGEHYRDMALYHRGRVLEALERPEEARAVYEDFVEEFPRETIATALVRDRLSELDPELAARLGQPPSMPLTGMP